MINSMVYITDTYEVGMNQITKEDQVVTLEIMSQLQNAKIHGFPFLNYVGVKKMKYTPNGLVMMVPSNPKKITAVMVTLRISDTYRVEFFQKNKVVETLNDIYNDVLAEAIARHLGVF